MVIYTVSDKFSFSLRPYLLEKLLLGPDRPSFYTAVLRDLARQQNKRKSRAHDFVQSNQFIFEVQTIIIARDVLLRARSLRTAVRPKKKNSRD